MGYVTPDISRNSLNKRLSKVTLCNMFEFGSSHHAFISLTPVVLLDDDDDDDDDVREYDLVTFNLN